jgi:GTP-binding protein HflX
MCGPGETRLEVDRRRIRTRIRDLKKSIEEVRMNRRQQRKNRLKSGLPLVSIVGYTNAGKSTLLHALTGAGVLVEDRLFATLDPTTRLVDEPDHQPFIITDTVGFIRKLPHQLVAAFRATLEEVQGADILIHVVDASHPAVGKHIEAVSQVLTELGIKGKPTITALNKLDLIDVDNLGDLPPCLPHPVKISAKTGAGLEDLLNEIDSIWASQRSRIKVTIPYTQMDLVSLLYDRGMVTSKSYLPEGIVVEAEVAAAEAELVLDRLDGISNQE